MVWLDGQDKFLFENLESTHADEFSEEHFDFGEPFCGQFPTRLTHCATRIVQYGRTPFGSGLDFLKDVC